MPLIANHQFEIIITRNCCTNVGVVIDEFGLCHKPFDLPPHIERFQKIRLNLLRRFTAYRVTFEVDWNEVIGRLGLVTFEVGQV